MNNYLLKYIEGLQKAGRYTFTLKEIRKVHPVGKDAVRLALNRLSRKRKIVPVRKGFYVIIPPEYAGMGILPPVLFIDDLMKVLNKPYYVSLFSASALHGAAHQQPFEFYVTTVYPAVRSINSNGLVINFYIKTRIPDTGIIEVKTDMGMVKVSGPELTAYDLVYFQNKAGGLNRAATAIDELSEKMDPAILKKMTSRDFSYATLQRLGYILDRVLSRKKLGAGIYGILAGRKIFPVPLKTIKSKTGFKMDPKWKIIINETIESEI